MATKKRKTSATSSPSARRSTASKRPALVAALGALEAVAEQLEARWFVFGAQAVALHGVPRMTQDIDVTVITEASPREIFNALTRAGITPRFRDEAFVRSTRVIPARHVSGWNIDVVLGGPGLDELIVAESVSMPVGKLRLPVVSLEHLLVLKTLAHRPQDVADITRLLELHGRTVDRKAVRQLLRELEQGLAEDGLVARFDALVG